MHHKTRSKSQAGLQPSAQQLQQRANVSAAIIDGGGICHLLREGLDERS